MKQNQVNSQSSKQVLDRLRVALQAHTDSALAKALGVAPSTLANWKRRNSVPYAQCVTVAQDERLHLEWLLTGVGDKERHGFVMPSVDAEILAISIVLARRFNIKHSKVEPSRLAHYIVSFYTNISVMYGDMERSAGLDRTAIIAAIRRSYRLPKDARLLTWGGSAADLKKVLSDIAQALARSD